jgi:hypothetical protein
MSKWLSKAKNRMWLYRVALAAVPLLVAYGVVSGDKAPLIVAAIGAIFAPAVALGNITPDQTDGN